MTRDDARRDQQGHRSGMRRALLPLAILTVSASSRAVVAEPAATLRPAAADTGAPVFGPSVTASLTEEQVAATASAIARQAVDEAAARQEEKENEKRAADRAEWKRALQTEREARAALEQRIRDADAAIARQTERPAVNTARPGLSLTGFVHADGALRQSSQDQVNPSTGAPLNQDRVSVRRARLRVSLERTFVTGALELDGNTTRGPAARLIGAEASLRLPPPAADVPSLLMVTIGMFKTPFGFEVLQSDRERLFLERSTAERGLFPGEYDAGMRVQGGWRFLRYVLGVMNGEPIGEFSFAGLDPNRHKDVVGRLGVDTRVEGPVSLSAGVSGLVGQGFHPGTPATKPALVWQDRNEDGQFQSTEIQLSPGIAPTTSQSFSRHGLGADVQVRVSTPGWGDTVGYAEGYLAKNLDRAILPADPYALVSTSYGAVARDLREIGWYAGITQDLGEHATVGVRYDAYNPDRDSADHTLGVQVPSDFSYHTWAFAAALRAPAGRLIAEVDINRNHLGRDAGGNPTNLRDNALTLRGEVKF